MYCLVAVGRYPLHRLGIQAHSGSFYFHEGY